MCDAKSAWSIITCEDNPKKDDKTRLCFFCVNLGATECPHLGKEKTGVCDGYIFDESDIPQTEKLVMALLQSD